MSKNEVVGHVEIGAGAAGDTEGTLAGDGQERGCGARGDRGGRGGRHREGTLARSGQLSSQTDCQLAQTQ